MSSEYPEDALVESAALDILEKWCWKVATI